MIVLFVLFRLASSLLMEPLIHSFEELIERSGFSHTDKAKIETMKLIHLMRSIGVIVSIISVGSLFQYSKQHDENVMSMVTSLSALSFSLFCALN